MAIGGLGAPRRTAEVSRIGDPPCGILLATLPAPITHPSAFAETLLSPAVLILAGLVYAGIFWTLAVRKPAIALMLIFASAPFQNDLSGGGPLKFSLTEINLLLALPVTLLKARRLYFGPAVFGALVYLAICLFSGLGQWRSTAPQSIVQIGLYTVVTVVIFASLPTREEDYTLSLIGLVAISTVIALAVCVMRTGYVFNLHKNGVGASLSTAFVVAIELWLRSERKRIRWVYLGAALVIAMACLITVSRGAWLTAISGTIVILVLRRRFALMLQCGAFLLPVILAGWFMLPEESRKYATGFDEGRFNIKARYESIDYATHVFLENPLQGAGIGLRKDYDATNLVLLTLAETGVPGFVTFVGLHVIIVAMVLSALRRTPPGTLSASILMLTLALTVGKFMHGLVDHYWSRGSLTAAWATVGMATRVAYERRSQLRQFAKSAPLRRHPPRTADHPQQVWPQHPDDYFMRIAISFPGCHRRGGVERVMVECLNHLAERDHEVHGFASDWDVKDVSPAVIRHQVSVRPPISALLSNDFRRRSTPLIQGIHPDVVASFGIAAIPGSVVWMQSVHAAWMDISARIRTFGQRVKQRLNPFHPIVLAAEKRLLKDRAYGRLIALTPRVKRDLIQYYSVPSEDIDILPNGFRKEEFNVETRRELRGGVRASLGLGDDARVLVFVANEAERKGLPQLLRALALLRNSSVHLLAVGRFDQGPYARLAASLGVASRVHFSRPTSRIAEFYAAGDYFVLPTQYEAWGLVIVEALACGLPVLTSRLAGASVAVQEGLTGRLIDDPCDVEEIADQLGRLLGMPVWPDEEISSSVDQFEWSQLLNRFEEILCSCKFPPGSGK